MSARPSGKMVKRWPSTSATKTPPARRVDPRMASGIAGGRAAGRRSFRVEATEPRGDRRSNRERPRVCCDGPAVHERDVRLDRGLVDQETRLEIVRAIDDDVDAIQDLPDRRRMDVPRDRFDLDLGVHGAEAFGSGLGLRPVDVAFRVQQLPLEIREFDDIPVDESTMPHAGPGEKVGRNAPEGPQSHHDGSGTRELALALDADLRKDFLPTVPIRRPHGRRKGAPLMAFRPPPLGWTPKDSRPSWKILSDSCRLTVGIAWIRWCRPRRPRGSRWRMHSTG